MKKKIVKLLSFSGLKNSELEELIEVPKDSQMGDYSFPCFYLLKWNRDASKNNSSEKNN